MTKAAEVPQLLQNLIDSGLDEDDQRAIAQTYNALVARRGLKPKAKTKVAASVKPVRTSKEKPMPTRNTQRSAVAELLTLLGIDPEPTPTPTPRRVVTKPKPKAKGDKFFREVIVARAKRRADEVKAGTKVVCADERCYKHGHAFINDEAHWGQHKAMFASWHQRVYGRKAAHR